MFEKARENFKSKISISKLWLIFSELILDKIKNLTELIPELAEYTTKQELMTLDGHLIDSLSCFNDNECEHLEARCLL